MFAVVVACAAVACSGKASPPAERHASSSGAVQGEAACDGRATEVATWFAAAVRDGRSGFRLHDDSRPFEVDDVPPEELERHELVAIRRATSSVRDEAVTPAELGRKLRVLDGIDDPRDSDPPPGAEIPAPRTPHVDFLIDRDVPLSRVAAFVEAARAAGFTQATFIFGHLAKTKPPARSTVSAEIDALLASRSASKAQALMEIVQRVVAPCESLTTLLADSARREGSMTYLVEGLGPALQRCSCSIDFEQLSTVLWTMAHGVGAPSTWVRATLAASDDAGAVVIHGATWADAARAVIDARGKRIRFGSRGP